MLSFKQCADVFRRVPPAPDFLASETNGVRQLFHEILCPLMANESVPLTGRIPGAVEDIRRLQIICEALLDEKRMLHSFYRKLKNTEPLLTLTNYI